LACYLAHLREKTPELADLFKAWPTLSEAVRMAIAALARSGK